MRKSKSPALFLAMLFCFSGTVHAEIQSTTVATLDNKQSAVSKTLDDAERTLAGGRIKMSGRYRLAAGATSDDLFVTEADSDLQERDSDYLFGDRLNNTYDPAIYDRLLLNIRFIPADRFSFYTQIVNDPWSWTGTTGEQVQASDITANEEVRYNLKYFGASNSTIPEIYRANTGDSVAFPKIKVKDDRLKPGTVVHGFFDFNPGTNGLPFTIPDLEVDYEYKPIRKLWMDYEEDEWHARIFALADQNQALTTDDPLGLSNHKDYWQQSPWLYQYKPVQFFTDGSIKRGFYDDTLSFLARDSEGNRLVLLRGASFEANLDETYLAGTVAAPYTPWDEDYFQADNVPGAFRMKHQVDERLMLGGVYTFRTGLINESVADFGQAGGVDATYRLDADSDVKAQIAISERDRDLLTDQRYHRTDEGFAYKFAYSTERKISEDRTSNVQLSYTQMDLEFDPLLSRYTNTRDDHFWGNHLTFEEYSGDLEHFRIGDGVDRNRIVVRARWKEKLFKERFENLFDVRNVRKQSNTAYLETVLRDEIQYKIDPQWTVKGLFRWHGMPTTTDDFEPFIANTSLIGVDDPASLRLQNSEVVGGADADRFTYAGGLQYVRNRHWTLEGFYERTNDIPDFPRGLMNSAFRDANDRVDGLLIDRLTLLLYDQSKVGGVPPYDYFNIFRERIIFKPQDNLKFTMHFAQNGYDFAGGIDDNINHEGVSIEYDHTNKMKFFFDYTHSRTVDLPKYIASDFADRDMADHHNLYGSFDYRINSKTVFRAEYGVFGLGHNTPLVTPYATTSFSLPTLDTEHLFRVSLTGDF